MNKDDKAIDAVKGYLSGLTKHEKERIIRELEQEEHDEQDWKGNPTVETSEE